VRTKLPTHNETTPLMLMTGVLLDFDNETADCWILWQDILEVALVQNTGLNLCGE